MPTVELPLFPLRTVLFPGNEIPLRIFEDRYKTMVQELLQTGGSFGVVLIKSGKEVGGDAVPRDIGTTAAITDYQELPDGRYMLDARGQQRFRVVRMLDPRPYPFGEVELLPDIRPHGDSRLDAALETVRATFPVYFNHALALTDQWARCIDLPDHPHDLVNTLAGWLQTDEESKQRLLEIESAADRVALLAEQLDDLVSRSTVQLVEHHREKYNNIGSNN